MRLIEENNIEYLKTEGKKERKIQIDEMEMWFKI